MYKYNKNDSYSMLLISNKNKMMRRFKFCIAFSDNLRGSFIVTMIPQTYEAAMAGRFSMQLSLFPIRDNYQSPVIEYRRSSHIWKGNSKNKEYGYDKDELRVRIKNSLCIVSLIEQGSITIHNAEFQAWLHVPGNIDLFVISDIFHFTDYYFVKAGYEYFPDWNDQYEKDLDKLRIERESEILNEREESFADYLSRLT